MGNDDEFELTMQPFIWKVGNFSDDVYPTDEELKAWHVKKVKGDVGVLEEEVGVDRWAFLKDWQTSVKEETLEKLSKRGSDDAEVRPFPFLLPKIPANVLRSTSANTSVNNSATFSRPHGRAKTIPRENTTRSCSDAR